MKTVNIYIINTEELLQDDRILPVIPGYYAKKYEKAKASKVKRQELAAGYLLATYLDVHGDDCIIENEHGKPAINPEAGIHIREFSISHCGNFVVLAVSDEPVGIDIEDSERMNLPVFKRILPEEYYERLVQGEFPMEEEFSKDEKLGQAKIWTTVEAIIKARGTGFKIDPKKDNSLFDSWHTKSIVYGGKYVITCALSNPFSIEVL